MSTKRSHVHWSYMFKKNCSYADLFDCDALIFYNFNILFYSFPLIIIKFSKQVLISLLRIIGYHHCNTRSLIFVWSMSFKYACSLSLAVDSKFSFLLRTYRNRQFRYQFLFFVIVVIFFSFYIFVGTNEYYKLWRGKKWNEWKHHVFTKWSLHLTIAKPVQSKFENGQGYEDLVTNLLSVVRNSWLLSYHSHTKLKSLIH